MKHIYKALFITLFLSSKIFSQTQGVLTCSFLPLAQSPCYQFTNSVMAVWIQDNASTFVKTKFRYVGSNTNDHLPNWALNSGGPSGNALSTLCNKTDATTGATRTSFTAKTFTWDGKNVSGASNGTVVADGIYQVTIEETWNHGSASAAVRSYTFTKGLCTETQTPAADAIFSGIYLKWVPTLIDTCLTPVKGIACVPSQVSYTCSTTTPTTDVSVRENLLSPKVSAFPNPSKGVITIDYSNTNKISIYNLLGEIVFEEKFIEASKGTKVIDLTGQKGIFLIRVLNENSEETYNVIVE